MARYKDYSYEQTKTNSDSILPVTILPGTFE